MSTPTNAITENVVEKFFNSPESKQKFEQILGGNTTLFIESIVQQVRQSPDLLIADLQSLFNAAYTAALVNLPINYNLQYVHISPVKDTKTGQILAQFQIGWRGLVQLGHRTERFKTMNAKEVKLGEFISEDGLTGECIFAWEQDAKKRAELPTVGYVGYFKLVNGFEKSIYKTITQVQEHAQKYSKTFGTKDSEWTKNPDGMGKKTVLKEALNNWAPLSTEMARAIQADQAVIKSIDGEGVYDYMDNPNKSDLESKKADKVANEKNQRKSQVKKAADDLELAIKRRRK